MKRTESNENALKDASKYAENAIDAVHAEKYASIPLDEKKAWAMAAMINCDVCRLVVAFDECEQEGIAKLLWMADIASKLYEVKCWYFKKGGRLLYDIARTKNSIASGVQIKIKGIMSKYPIENIDAYKNYRNKISYDYDNDALKYLMHVGNENADSFHKLLKMFVQFSREWAQLTDFVINPLAAQEAKQV